MALIKLGSTRKTDLNFDKKELEMQVNTNLSQGQKDSGVVAKVQVRYMGFTVVATIWDSDGRKRLSTPAQKGTNQFFSLAAVNRDVRDYIIEKTEAVLSGEDIEDNSAWYRDEIGTREITITDEASNASLGIENIIVDANLTKRQRDAGMLCKVTIETKIGNFYSYTMFKSKFGNSLYGVIPAEGATEDSRGVPGYRLSREVTAQVLNHVHKLVDWSEDAPSNDNESADADNKTADNTGKPAGKAGRKASGAVKTETGDFKPIDDKTVFEG